MEVAGRLDELYEPLSHWDVLRIPRREFEANQGPKTLPGTLTPDAGLVL